MADPAARYLKHDRLKLNIKTPTPILKPTYNVCYYDPSPISAAQSHSSHLYSYYDEESKSPLSPQPPTPPAKSPTSMSHLITPLSPVGNKHKLAINTKQSSYNNSVVSSSRYPSLSILSPFDDSPPTVGDMYEFHISQSTTSTTASSSYHSSINAAAKQWKKASGHTAHVLKDALLNLLPGTGGLSKNRSFSTSAGSGPPIGLSNAAPSSTAPKSHKSLPADHDPIFDLPPIQVVRSKCSYDAQFKNEISFAKGDFFFVVEERADGFYRITNPSLKLKGLAPSHCFESLTNGPQGQRMRKMNSAHNASEDILYSSTTIATTTVKSPSSAAEPSFVPSTLASLPRISSDNHYSFLGSIPVGSVSLESLENTFDQYLTFMDDQDKDKNAKSLERGISSSASEFPAALGSLKLNASGKSGELDDEDDEDEDHRETLIRSQALLSKNTTAMSSSLSETEVVSFSQYHNHLSGMLSSKPLPPSPKSETPPKFISSARLNNVPYLPSPEHEPPALATPPLTCSTKLSFNTSSRDQLESPISSACTSSSPGLFKSISIVNFEPSSPKGPWTFTIDAVTDQDWHKLLFRSYEDVWALHVALLTHFPKEGGQLSGHSRQIPFLEPPVNLSQLMTVADTDSEGLESLMTEHGLIPQNVWQKLKQQRRQMELYLILLNENCPHLLNFKPCRRFFDLREGDLHSPTPHVFDTSDTLLDLVSEFQTMSRPESGNMNHDQRPKYQEKEPVSYRYSRSEPLFTNKVHLLYGGRRASIPMDALMASEEEYQSFSTTPERVPPGIYTQLLHTASLVFSLSSISYIMYKDETQQLCPLLNDLDLSLVLKTYPNEILFYVT